MKTACNFQTNWRFVLMVLILSTSYGCGEHLPPSNTPAYDALHGIVNDGKTRNTITLITDAYPIQVSLSFPPELYVSVDTPNLSGEGANKIRKGFAYTASFALNFTEAGEVAIGAPNRKRPIDVDLNAYGSHKGTAVYVQKQLSELYSRTKHISAIPEYGLTAYQTDSYVHYFPPDKSLEDVTRRDFGLSCRMIGTYQKPDFKPVWCWMGFINDKGISVSLSFGPELIPFWKSIYFQTAQLVDQLINK